MGDNGDEEAEKEEGGGVCAGWRRWGVWLMLGVVEREPGVAEVVERILWGL